MRFVAAVALALSPVLMVPALRAPARAGTEDPPGHSKTPARSPSAEFQAITAAFRQAQADFLRAYAGAATPAERARLGREQYPQPRTYARRVLALVERHPKDPFVPGALAWVVTTAPGTPEADSAAQRLFSDHADSRAVGPVCPLLRSPRAEEYLRRVLAHNPYRDVRGTATLALARTLRNRAEGADPADDARRTALLEEARTLFERVAGPEFAAVHTPAGTLADAAGRDLFELRHLTVGRPAPDIEGEDTDGKKFKLSDYRGKVVLLDFWGHW